MKNKAVFLDRDGVLIAEKGHLSDPANARLIRGAAEAVKMLNKGFRVIVVSNQSAIARGLATEPQVKKINSLIRRALAAEGAKIDAFYYCPHHPDFTGKCACRKPGIGFLLEAKKKFSIELGKSFFVGDKTVDTKTGKNAGCTTILVETGYGGSDKEFDAVPDFVAKDVLAAAKKIISLSGLNP